MAAGWLRFYVSSQSLKESDEGLFHKLAAINQRCTCSIKVRRRCWTRLSEAVLVWGQGRIWWHPLQSQDSDWKVKDMGTKTIRTYQNERATDPLKEKDY